MQKVLLYLVHKVHMLFVAVVQRGKIPLVLFLERNVWKDGVDLSPPFAFKTLAFFNASVLNVILQRLMPFYRLRQSGESTTLLPTATHIDIAAAMAGNDI